MEDLLASDGRARVLAPKVLGPARRQKFSVAMVRNLIHEFDKRGSTNHSGGRGMLGFIIAHCEEKRIPYTLRAHFTADGGRAGYFLQREELLQ